MNDSYQKLFSLYNEKLLDSLKDNYALPLNNLDCPETLLEKKIYLLQSLAEVFENTNSFISFISTFSHDLTKPVSNHEDLLSDLDFSNDSMERISKKYFYFVQSYFKFFLLAAIFKSSQEDVNERILNFFKNTPPSTITQQTILDALFGE